MRSLTRRDTLFLGLGTAAITVAGPGRMALATPAEVEAEIAKFTGGQAAPAGRITIDLPEIAENGNAIALFVTVDSPMTASDHVTDILVLAEGNPRPGVASFRFSPMSGRAEAATRIRLATTQNVVVVARMNDGRFRIARKEVKVTIGGCGG